MPMSFGRAEPVTSLDLSLPAAHAANDDELRARPWNSRHFIIPDHLPDYPTMMTGEEVRMLAYLARYACLPRGRVYDLGPFLGGSTYPLAWGVMQRGLPEAVVSIDQFRASEKQKNALFTPKGLQPLTATTFSHCLSRWSTGCPLRFTAPTSVSLLLLKASHCCS